MTVPEQLRESLRESAPDRSCPVCGCPIDAGEPSCIVCETLQGPGRQLAQLGPAYNAMVHGAYSERARVLAEPLRLELRAAVLSDQGHGEADVPAVLSVMVDQFTEARMLALAYWTFLAESGGPITTKGRQRRAVDGYLRAAAAVEKLARRLGLRRQTRTVTQTPREWLESLAAPADEHGDSEGTGDTTTT